MVKIIDPQLTKVELRRKLLKQRQSLHEVIWQEKSNDLCQILKNFPLFQQAKTILAYFSIRREPDLSPLFQSSHYWGFSRCVGTSLIWHHWQIGDRLNTGNYGILEPLPDAPIIAPSQVDLILIPSIACDLRGYRLGYGGGFYDRLLSSPDWQRIPSIGIIFEGAYCDQLPADSWDFPLTGICTESQIWLQKAQQND